MLLKLIIIITDYHYLVCTAKSKVSSSHNGGNGSALLSFVRRKLFVDASFNKTLVLKLQSYEEMVSELIILMNI